jgi:hypothetical protein
MKTNMIKMEKNIMTTFVKAAVASVALTAAVAGQASAFGLSGGSFGNDGTGWVEATGTVTALPQSCTTVQTTAPSLGALDVATGTFSGASAGVITVTGLLDATRATAADGIGAGNTTAQVVVVPANASLSAPVFSGASSIPVYNATDNASLGAAYGAGALVQAPMSMTAAAAGTGVSNPQANGNATASLAVDETAINGTLSFTINIDASSDAVVVGELANGANSGDVFSAVYAHGCVSN